VKTVVIAQPFARPEHQAFDLPGTDPTVLALHGFLGTPAELRPLARVLASRGAEVCAPLLPGFGADLARLPSVTAEDWVGRGLALWRELRTRSHGSAVLLGFSMGAALALQVAAAEPPAKLVLLAPFTRLLPGDWRVPFLPLARRVIRDLRPFRDADFSSPAIRQVFQAIDPDLDLEDLSVQAVLRDLRLPLSALDELRRTGERALDAASRVRSPVLVVQARDDQTVPTWTTRKLVERLGGPVTLVEVPGDHQLVQPDHPSAALVYRVVERFLTGDYP
jgi:carboxylesterase